eukprot:6206365-Pleurochrysis_carterae.AAC.3
MNVCVCVFARVCVCVSQRVGAGQGNEVNECVYERERSGKGVRRRYQQKEHEGEVAKEIRLRGCFRRKRTQRYAV